MWNTALIFSNKNHGLQKKKLFIGKKVIELHIEHT